MAKWTYTQVRAASLGNDMVWRAGDALVEGDTDEFTRQQERYERWIMPHLPLWCDSAEFIRDAHAHAEYRLAHGKTFDY